MSTLADRLDHVAGLLAIATPDTLASAGFQATIRRRLAAIAAELRASQAAADTPDAAAP